MMVFGMLSGVTRRTTRDAQTSGDAALPVYSTNSTTTNSSEHCGAKPADIACSTWAAGIFFPTFPNVTLILPGDP